MKRNSITVTVGLLLILVFGFLLFSFQVRQTEVALITTFGKPTDTKTNSGLYFKLPWPIQKVVPLDKRIQNFEDKFEETPTRDGINLLVMLYGGWTINNPTLFRERFAGDVSRAQTDLQGLIRSAKNAVVGQHPFSDFISTDEKALKLPQIEREILQAVQSQALNNYGMEIKFVGIKKLGLPESITAKVFDRMRQERNRFVAKLQAEGEAASINIRSAAEREKAQVLNHARAEAIRIRGEADRQADAAYAVFEKNPELAILLLKLNALEVSLKDKATLFLDERTPPFDLLNVAPQNNVRPAARN